MFSLEAAHRPRDSQHFALRLFCNRSGDELHIAGTLDKHDAAKQFNRLRRLNYNRVEYCRLLDLAEAQSFLRSVYLPEVLGCLFGGVKREHPPRKRRFIQCRADVHGHEGLQERNLCFRPRIFYQANKARKCRRDLRLVVHQQRIVR